MSKNEDMAFLFLDRGANFNTLDVGGNTPLHLASAAGCVGLAQQFLEDFPAQVDRRNKAGQTALLRSCETGHFEIAQILLDAGAYPSMTNDHGATQLGDLAASNQRQSVGFLLDAGADLDSLDSFGRTALYRAAEDGHFGLCNDLMQWGANPNIVVHGGDSTPLGEAASNGFSKTVECLIEGGADIEGRDRRGRTPFFRAASHHQLEVCRALLEREASPNPGLALPDDDDDECQWDMTPLQFAAFFGLDELAELLVEYDVHLDEADQWGRTALSLAAGRGQVDVCQVLVDAGADCDAQVGGASVVSTAAQRGHFEVVQLLLQGGAEALPPPSVKGQKWKNFAFDSGVMSGRKQDILELLRSYKHSKS